MKIPKHFDSTLEFRVYILECAVRDRETFLEAIECMDSAEDLRDETYAELREFRRRIKLLTGE